jgi:hypothetical protein
MQQSVQVAIGHAIEGCLKTFRSNVKTTVSNFQEIRPQSGFRNRRRAATVSNGRTTVSKTVALCTTYLSIIYRIMLDRIVRKSSHYKKDLAGRGILTEHPKKFSVVMVKRKSLGINEQFLVKPFCQCHWEI